MEPRARPDGGAAPLSPGPAPPGAALAPAQVSPWLPESLTIQEAPGPGGEGTCPARGSARARKSLRPPPRRAYGRNAGERKTCPRRGRLSPASPQKPPPAAARSPGLGPRARRGGEVWARPPARRGAPLRAGRPLAVPAAPLQDEVAVALLSHPELQSVLQQHLLGLENHIAAVRPRPRAPAHIAPAAGPSPLGRRRREHSLRAPCAPKSGSAAGAARPGSPRAVLVPAPPWAAPPARPGPAPGPPPGTPTACAPPTPPAPVGGDVLISESWRLQAVRVEGGSPIPAAPRTSPALAGAPGPLSLPPPLRGGAVRRAATAARRGEGGDGGKRRLVTAAGCRPRAFYVLGNSMHAMKGKCGI